jgi:hypothetical protein
MAVRDADARVARMNARLESMSAVLIGVVWRGEEVDCNNQRNLVVGCGYTATEDSFSSFALNSVR